MKEVGGEFWEKGLGKKVVCSHKQKEKNQFLVEEE